MHSHGLQQFVHVKSSASCQQICCNLIVKICYPQACCQLQQVVKRMQMTSCNKPDFKDLFQLDETDKSVGTIGKINMLPYFSPMINYSRF